MSANNRRLRRMVVDILYEKGALTRVEIAKELADKRSLREVPSDNSLSSVLAKNVQIECVGYAVVEKLNGSKTKHMVFDIRRDLIQSEEDIPLTRPVSCMTGAERIQAQRCSQCGRQRLMPDGEQPCLHCRRGL